ncbi:TetR/AcrR family transcriptional regulator [uncultured Alistipes sp.]|uniref:TetR/AcrR family transcriptional regulator n=1 Tax=uncultured Alistipes sp. TaxID=538949 RepID=UPI001F9AC8E8|nr:TetR/AcrR family transcriptional regulator [uncultured Alistipes sp.]HJC27014.1 TetR/AcrR family transcriptional regulator [Candidatus Alistipes stercoravium]
MKRGATKEEIIRTTQDLIARNGIRAVRVDEIAQMLGISKRTLYEMFADKNDLIGACLTNMARQQRKTLASNRRRCGNPLQKALRLANTYIDNLYTVDASFLADIRNKVLFAEYYNENRDFWFSELTRDLETCRKEELLLAEMDAAALTQQLLSSLLELRLNHATREELYLLCRTILRGAATKQGIDYLDRNR